MHTIKTHPSTPYLKSALQSSSKACRWSRALSYRPTGAESPEKRTAVHHKNTKRMGQSIIIYIIIITWGEGGHMMSGRLQGGVCVRRGQSSSFYFFFFLKRTTTAFWLEDTERLQCLENLTQLQMLQVMSKGSYKYLDQREQTS